MSKIISAYIAIVLTGMCVLLGMIYTKLPQQYTRKEMRDSHMNSDQLPVSYIYGGSVDVGNTVDVNISR